MMKFRGLRSVEIDGIHIGDAVECDLIPDAKVAEDAALAYVPRISGSMSYGKIPSDTLAQILSPKMEPGHVEMTWTHRIGSTPLSRKARREKKRLSPGRWKARRKCRRDARRRLQHNLRRAHQGLRLLRFPEFTVVLYKCQLSQMEFEKGQDFVTMAAEFRVVPSL